MREIPSRERIESVDRIMQWTDSLPLKYRYTVGVAGELFFEWLKKGKIEASRCERCGVSYLPPRIYCLSCFKEVHSFIEVEGPGRVAATCSVPATGANSGLQEHYVFVVYKGVKGGMMHRVAAGKPRIGARAIAVFKPKEERTGSVLDILGFKIL